MITTFPGGTSITLLGVYHDVAPDGLAGGSPHMHLASTECYIVVGGSGALQTVDAHGYRETALSPGVVVWFTPGTIHRAVNHGALQVVVLMGNAGLPEAGDAVMTFPADVVSDHDRYRAAATLPARATVPERARDAAKRRDLAVEGFVAIRDAIIAGDDGPLQEFYGAAAALVEQRASGWASIVADGPVAQAEQSSAIVEELARGRFGHLRDSAVHRAPEPDGERAFGMCGRLRTYDVGNAMQLIPLGT
jgi:mannose-6-phosphate isomerase-like protein (cupin superfamily)